MLGMLSRVDSSLIGSSQLGSGLVVESWEAVVNFSGFPLAEGAGWSGGGSGNQCRNQCRNRSRASDPGLSTSLRTSYHTRGYDAANTWYDRSGNPIHLGIDGG